jgi:hypothetical protein
MKPEGPPKIDSKKIDGMNRDIGNPKDVLHTVNTLINLIESS